MERRWQTSGWAAEIAAAAREEAGDPWDAAYAMKALAPLSDEELRAAFAQPHELWPPRLTEADLRHARTVCAGLLAPEPLPDGPEPPGVDVELLRALADMADDWLPRDALVERTRRRHGLLANQLREMRRLGWVESRRTSPGGPALDRLTEEGRRVLARLRRSGGAEEQGSKGAS